MAVASRIPLVLGLLLWGCSTTTTTTVLDAGSDQDGAEDDGDADGSTGDGEADGKPGDGEGTGDGDEADGAGDGTEADGEGDEVDDQIEGYRLIWSDEFNVGSAPDDAKWNYEVQGPGFVNEELQNYTGHRSENARLEDGKLVIEARRDFFDGHEYSSARLHSAGKGELTYGRVVARAKVPRGVGTWPAIWMMPADIWRYASSCNAQTGWIDGCDAWPASGEIDIMEHVGYELGVVHATIHCRAFNWMQAAQKTATTPVPDAADAFHEYAVERTQDRIAVSVDGNVFFEYANDYTGPDTWPFDAPFYVILNVAVGGLWGGRNGVDANAFPTRMEVDWVRMYERE